MKQKSDGWLRLFNCNNMKFMVNFLLKILKFLSTQRIQEMCNYSKHFTVSCSAMLHIYTKDKKRSRMAFFFNFKFLKILAETVNNNLICHLQVFCRDDGWTRLDGSVDPLTGCSLWWSRKSPQVGWSYKRNV